MKTSILPLALSLALASAALAGETAAPKPAPIILDAVGVKNLRLETAVAEPADFEETLFALGRVEAKPSSVAAISSRISGRVVGLAAFPGDAVDANAEIVKVESRQPGNPPPAIALVSPLRGAVTRLDVRLGDPVEPDRALVEISDLSEVLAIARVPEHSIAKLKPGAMAHIALAALSPRVFEGSLLRFGTAVDSAPGTLDAVFLLKNTDGQIRPGMRAEFSIVLEKHADVVAVPRSAVQGEGAGRFVFVKDFGLPNAFLKTPVVTGRSNDRVVEIVSGLLPADEVVTQGAYSLAFAGSGSVSLKDALDAAHGHAHAADGSELLKSGADDHDHDHDHEDEVHRGLFWKILSGVLFVLLVIVAFRKKAAPAVASSPRAS